MAVDVRLRAATVADIPLLHEWDRDPVVAASSGDDDEFDWEFEVPRSVPWRELLIAEADGEPVGFMQLIDAAEEETHYWGEVEPNVWAIDIWIGAARHRGRGIGAEMMRQALDRCFARPEVTAVLIDPLRRNERAISFYERMGFRHVEIRWFDQDECAVMRIDRPAGMAAVEAYLESVPEPQRSTLRVVRARLRTVLPDAEEGMKYRMPSFIVDGKGIAAYAAFTHHCSYFPFSGSVLAATGPLQGGTIAAKGTLQFPVDAPLPISTVRELVRARLAELAAST